MSFDNIMKHKCGEFFLRMFDSAQVVISAHLKQRDIDEASVIHLEWLYFLNVDLKARCSQRQQMDG